MGNKLKQLFLILFRLTLYSTMQYLFSVELTLYEHKPVTLLICNANFGETMKWSFAFLFAYFYPWKHFKQTLVWFKVIA